MQNVSRTCRKEGFDASIVKENSNIIPDLMNILTKISIISINFSSCDMHADRLLSANYGNQ